MSDGDVIRFGDDEKIRVAHTSGHTAGRMNYVWRGNASIGDTLLIDGCGRTDFRGGSSGALHGSVTRKIFTLPDDTLMCRDYKGQAVSTIVWRGAYPRLVACSPEDFAKLVSELDLPGETEADRCSGAGEPEPDLPPGA